MQFVLKRSGTLTNHCCSKSFTYGKYFLGLKLFLRNFTPVLSTVAGIVHDKRPTTLVVHKTFITLNVDKIYSRMVHCTRMCIYGWRASLWKQEQRPAETRHNQTNQNDTQGFRGDKRRIQQVEKTGMGYETTQKVVLLVFWLQKTKDRIDEIIVLLKSYQDFRS